MSDPRRFRRLLLVPAAAVRLSAGCADDAGDDGACQEGAPGCTDEGGGAPAEPPAY